MRAERVPRHKICAPLSRLVGKMSFEKTVRIVVLCGRFSFRPFFESSLRFWNCSYLIKVSIFVRFRPFESVFISKAISEATTYSSGWFRHAKGTDEDAGPQQDEAGLEGVTRR